ncbi:hypothetical protein ACVGXN_15020, partial [Enterobacter hormaechei]
GKSARRWAGGVGGSRLTLVCRFYFFFKTENSTPQPPQPKIKKITKQKKNKKNKKKKKKKLNKKN